MPLAPFLGALCRLFLKILLLVSAAPCAGTLLFCLAGAVFSNDHLNEIVRESTPLTAVSPVGCPFCSKREERCRSETFHVVRHERNITKVVAFLKL